VQRFKAMEAETLRQLADLELLWPKLTLDEKLDSLEGFEVVMSSDINV
jgi:hypothetical protein